MSLNLIYKVALPSQSWVTNTIKKRGVNERIKVLILLTNSIMQIEKPYIYIYIYIELLFYHSQQQRTFGDSTKHLCSQ